jgi:hypothetical protein
MDVYSLGKVVSITHGPRSALGSYSFSVIGVLGRPVVSFAFDRKKADAAHAAMQAIVETVKLITPHH